MMNRIKGMLAVAVAGAVWVNSEAAVEKPVVMAEAMASATVSDLHGFIDGAGSVVAQIAPMFNGMMLKNMLGSKLGDPQLEGIPAGKGLSIVMLDTTNIFAVIEVGEANMAAYTNTIANMGLQVKVADGLLVAASASEALEKGTKLAKTVQQQLLIKRSSSLKISGKPADYLAENSQKVEEVMGMWPMMIGMQSARASSPEKAEVIQQILEAELRVFASLIGQIGQYEVELAPVGGSIRIAETVAPKVGSRLETLLKSPIVNQFDPNLQAKLLDSGAVQLEFCMMNPKAFMAFVEAEAKQVVAQMGLNEELVTKVMAYNQKWMDVLGGSLSKSIINGSGMFSMDYLLAVKDEKAALELIKNVQADMEKAQVFEFYKKMGMPASMEFKESARMHKGTPIHQFSFKISFENMPEAERKQAEEMCGNMVFDVAITNGVMVYTMEPGKMESILDTLQSSDAPANALVARSVFPQGGFFYADLNMGKYLAFVASFIPAEQQTMVPIGQFAALLSDAEPLTAAGFWGNGLLRFESNISGDFIIKMGQAAMMIQMQQSQQQTAPAQ